MYVQKNIMQIITSWREVFIIVGAVIFITFGGSGVHAVDPAECAQMGGVVQGTVCVPTKAKTGLSDTPISQIIVAVAEWIITVFGALAIITFVICGFQYVLSLGDDAQAENAKRCMKWAVVGVAVTGMALVFAGLIAKILAGVGPSITL